MRPVRRAIQQKGVVKKWLAVPLGWSIIDEHLNLNGRPSWEGGCPVASLISPVPFQSCRHHPPVSFIDDGDKGKSWVNCNITPSLASIITGSDEETWISDSSMLVTPEDLI